MPLNFSFSNFSSLNLLMDHLFLASLFTFLFSVVCSSEKHLDTCIKIISTLFMKDLLFINDLFISTFKITPARQLHY